MPRFGPFEVTAELGRGGMGVVYRGFDPTIRREVAIKTIRLNDIDDPAERRRMRERLEREAQSAGCLSHPNIVTIYQLGYDTSDSGETTAFIAMELVQGRTLASLLAEGRPLNLSLAVRLLHQAATALDYAHQRGVIHRDVKPANLLITPEATLKVTDFGVAKISAHTLTMTGTILGSPFYMSPEQIRGDKVDPRADQYSLAVVAFEVFGGHKPFDAETLSSLVYKIVHEPPPQLSLPSSTLAAAVNPIIQKALSKAADGRFPSCTAFITALEDALNAATAASASSSPQFLSQPSPAPQHAPPATLSPVSTPPSNPLAAPSAQTPSAPFSSTAKENSPRRFIWAALLVPVLIGVLWIGSRALTSNAPSGDLPPAASTEPAPPNPASEPTLLAGTQTPQSTPGSSRILPPAPSQIQPSKPEPARATPAAPPPASSTPPAAKPSATQPSASQSATPAQAPPAQQPAAAPSTSSAPAPPPAAAPPERQPEPAREPVRTPPRLIRQTQPSYTPDALQRGIQGVVVLSVDINDEGVPVRARIVRSLDAGLDRKAIEAVSQWRFQPATLDGAPAASTANIEVRFENLGAPTRKPPSLKKPG